MKQCERSIDSSISYSSHTGSICTAEYLWRSNRFLFYTSMDFCSMMVNVLSSSFSLSTPFSDWAVPSRSLPSTQNTKHSHLQALRLWAASVNINNKQSSVYSLICSCSAFSSSTTSSNFIFSSSRTWFRRSSSCTQTHKNTNKQTINKNTQERESLYVQIFYWSIKEGSNLMLSKRNIVYWQTEIWVGRKNNCYKRAERDPFISTPNITIR